MRDGRLDIDEYGDRTARLTAAKTRGELLALFSDLPEPRPAMLRDHLPTPPRQAWPERRRRREPRRRSGGLPAGVVPIAIAVGIALILLRVPVPLVVIPIVLLIGGVFSGRCWSGRS